MLIGEQLRRICVENSIVSFATTEKGILGAEYGVQRADELCGRRRRLLGCATRDRAAAARVPCALFLCVGEQTCGSAKTVKGLRVVHTYKQLGIPRRSRVVLDVQIAFDARALARIDVFYLVSIMFPQWGIRVHVIVRLRRRLVDDLEEWLGNSSRGRGRRREGGSHDVQYFFHAVTQSIFQLLDDLREYIA